MRKKYYSTRIRARVARALLEEFGGCLYQLPVVYNWMGYTHPEAWGKDKTSYALEMKEALQRFLTKSAGVPRKPSEKKISQ